MDFTDLGNWDPNGDFSSYDPSQSTGFSTGNTTPTAPAPDPSSSLDWTQSMGGSIDPNTGLPAGFNLPGMDPASLAKLLGPNALQTLLGKGLPAALGFIGSTQQKNAYQTLAGNYAAMGAPYRARLADLYNNPSSFLTSPQVTVPVQQGTDILAHSLSTGGNPAASGNALQQMQSYATNQLYGRLGDEENRLAGFGGLTSYNAAAPGAASNAIGATGNQYNAIGAGASDIFNPQPSVAQTMADYQRIVSGGGASGASTGGPRIP